jgi:hypothetical protein
MLKAGRLRCKRHRPYESQHHVKRAQERIYKQQEGAHLVTKKEVTRRLVALRNQSPNTRPVFD